MCLTECIAAVRKLGGCVRLAECRIRAQDKVVRSMSASSNISEGYLQRQLQGQSMFVPA